MTTEAGIAIAAGVAAVGISLIEVPNINAAIQLARWAGATVISTISSDEKAALATAAV